jgi:hypothetical protein
VVLDRKGRKVKNLTAGEVGIYEDGVLQQIQSFRLVTGGDAPAPSQPSSIQPGPGKPKMGDCGRGGVPQDSTAPRHVGGNLQSRFAAHVALSLQQQSR